MATADDCTFCKISAGKDEETEIIFKRDGFTAFRDIKPAARHHYLIIPDEHIPDPKHLDGNHVELVEKMVSIGKQLIQDREDTLDDISQKGAINAYIRRARLNVPTNGSEIMEVESTLSGGLGAGKIEEDETNERQLGFHWPPFHLVHHLHLHVISPTGDMNFFARGIFKPNSFWFVTADWLLERLKKMRHTKNSEFD